MKKALITGSVLVALVRVDGAQSCIENAREVKPVISDLVRAEYSRKLADAKFVLERTPGDADAIIWLGRRTAYLGEYKAAIRVFSEGISKYPGDARMYRHRGHRSLTLRCFDDAIVDLERAATLVKGKPDEIEPDGLPNAKNIPTSTLQSNIWYHLGLAYYLKGDLKNALNAYGEAGKVSKSNDMKVATAYWRYMTLRRSGKDQEAKRALEPYKGEIEVIENTDYLKLIKLNRGEVKADDLLASIGGDADTLGSASLGYGIGNYLLYNGDNVRARAVFQKIVNGNQWASFGYIASEVELGRLPAGNAR